MFFDQKVCEGSVLKKQGCYLSVRVITLKTLLDILEIGDHRYFRTDPSQLWSFFQLLFDHVLQRGAFEFHEFVVI